MKPCLAFRLDAEVIRRLGPMTNTQISKTAESAIVSLIPDAAVRKRCLLVFLEAMIEANKYGPNDKIGDLWLGMRLMRLCM